MLVTPRSHERLARQGFTCPRRNGICRTEAKYSCHSDGLQPSLLMACCTNFLTPDATGLRIPGRYSDNSAMYAPTTSSTLDLSLIPSPLTR